MSAAIYEGPSTSTLDGLARWNKGRAERAVRAKAKGSAGGPGPVVPVKSTGELSKVDLLILEIQAKDRALNVARAEAAGWRLQAADLAADNDRLRRCISAGGVHGWKIYNGRPFPVKGSNDGGEHA